MVVYSMTFGMMSTYSSWSALRIIDVGDRLDEPLTMRVAISLHTVPGTPLRTTFGPPCCRSEKKRQHLSRINWIPDTCWRRVGEQMSWPPRSSCFQETIGRGLPYPSCNDQSVSFTGRSRFPFHLVDSQTHTGPGTLSSDSSRLR